MRTTIATLFCVALFAAPSALFAAEDEGDEGMETLAVQNRQHTMTHEFGVWIGTLPLDAFTKGLTFTGAYSLHFNDVIGWEVGQFTYSHGIDTDLKQDLKDLQIGPTPFEVVRYYITSSVLFKPVYGKLAILNRSLIFGEMFILAGGGYGWMTITSRPVVNVGLGFRVYVGEVLSFRLDFRDYAFINKDDMHSELWIALGVCLSIK